MLAIGNQQYNIKGKIPVGCALAYNKKQENIFRAYEPSYYPGYVMLNLFQDLLAKHIYVRQEILK